MALGGQYNGSDGVDGMLGNISTCIVTVVFGSNAKYLTQWKWFISEKVL